MQNLFAKETIKYIWSHPNCRKQKVYAILRFIVWQFYKRLFRRPIDIQIIPQVKIRCYPDSYSASSVLYCGLYDYNEMNFLLRYLRDKDSFLDIGANVGIYTLLAASQIKYGSIYSFEAVPKNYQRLETNLALNKLNQVKSFAIAVSDFFGSLTLNLAEGDSMAFITQEETHNTIRVQTNTLDNLLQNQPLNQLTLGKLDIEGAEILALKGATSLLKQQYPYVWILEINNSVNKFGYQKQDIVNLLQDYGYGLYSYDADINKLHKISLDRQQGNNVLAIANSALDFVHARLTHQASTN